ncbi:MAG: hypothetical protein ACM3W4_05800 [Ignavibacteriales bacterium]
MSLHLTYELYLQHGDGTSTFEPLTCANQDDLLATMQRLLDERGLVSIEARQFGQHLMTLAS